MSKHSLNKNNYNIDKLNFKKIKKELEIIPKIIKNHNKIGLSPCFSMTDISNNLNEDFLIRNLKQNQNKSSSMKNIYDRNDTNTTINEEILIKIKRQNKKEINDIKNLYERKIKEMTLFYENKYLDLTKLLNKSLNDYKALVTDYIPLTQHKSIVNDLKKKYNDLLNKTKENYEKLINQLTDIMKNKTKYKDLIHRLQLYTLYEVEINEIEKILVNNLKEKMNESSKRQNNNYYNDFYLVSQLDEDINYHKKIYELKQTYLEKLSEIKINSNNKIDNLINQVKYIFDKYSNYSSDNFLNNDKVLDNYNLDKGKNLKNKSNKKESKNDFFNLSQYKENECKSISNSIKNSDNDEAHESSSKEIDNLLNIGISDENRLKPEAMEINYKPFHLK